MSGLPALMRSLELVLDGSPWNNGKNTGLRAAREAVRVALADPELLCDCVELELQLLRNKSDGSNLTPFVNIPSIQAGIAFGYWAPLGATGPHEHTAWTITAVVRNTLDICVYDWDKSYECGTLVESQIVKAVSPDVGYICSPTIHDVRNGTASWSLALHVLSDHDGQRPANHPKSIIVGLPETSGDDPYRSVNSARVRRAKVLQMAEVLRDSVANPATFGRWFEQFIVGKTAARINTLLGLGETSHASLRRLRRTHSDLRLSVEQIDTQFRLWAYGDHGAHAQIDVNVDFAEPLLFIAEQLEFDIESLPGNLTISERQAFARVLEDSCLFETLE